MVTHEKFGEKIENGWFDGREGRHVYRDEKGAIVPSSTQIIALAGFSDFSRVKPEVLNRKRQIGSAVHLATQFIDQSSDGELDWESVHESCVGYVLSYEHAVEDLKLEPMMVEKASIVTINGLKYGVRLDRAGTRGDKRVPIVWDIKCGLKPSIAWALQTASQELALPKVKDIPGFNGHERWERAALQLRKDGTYRPYKHEDVRHHNWFLCALTLAWVKMTEGMPLPNVPEEEFGEEEES